MRKYIYSIFLLGLFSCQEEGVVQYTQEKDGLQFSANSSEDMTKVFNFATATYEEEINGEPKTFYYGDSLAAIENRFGGRPGFQQGCRGCV